MSFTVEGRSFPNSLHAFTFASIQADRMNRPVEVRVLHEEAKYLSDWHATAQPSNFVRRHLVKQS
jgi:hypothetical protein